MPIFVRDVNLDLDLHGVLVNLVFLQTVIYALLIIIDASLVHLHMGSNLLLVHVSLAQILTAKFVVLTKINAMYAFLDSVLT